MGEEKEYIQRLAVAKCSCGSMDFQYLNLPRDHGVYFQDTDHPMMNALDHAADEHILQFGRCKAPSNPGNIAGDFVSAVIPIFGLAKQLKRAMGCEGCKCSPKTLKVWERTDEGNCLDGADGIINQSVAQCFYGGQITITEEPQPDQTDENKKKADKKDPKKSVLDRMPEEMAKKVKSLNEAPVGNPSAAVGVGSVSAGGTGGTGSSNGTGSVSAGGTGGAGQAKGGLLTGGISPLITGSCPAFSKLLEQELLDDMASWYEDHSEDFIQNYGVSDAVSLYNYANNMRQAIPSSCLNAEGLICDLSGLSSFRMGGGSAAQLGAACAASYNVLRRLGEPPSLSSIIFAAEKQQTVKGFMDQGPMAVSMGSMKDYFGALGFETRVVSPQDFCARQSAAADRERKDASSIALLCSSIRGKPSFLTVKHASDGRMYCAEKPELEGERLFTAKEKQPKLMLEVSRRDTAGNVTAGMKSGRMIRR